MVSFKFAFAVQIALVVGACTPYPVQTDYPGSGLGTIQARTERGGGPTAFGPDGKPVVYRIPVIGKNTGFQVETSGPPGSTSFVYEIRGVDGTVHIVGSKSPFAIGSCVAFSGYADGPSRTHWSVGRVTLEPSNNCGK